jgi:hypothetical protein
VEIMPRFLTALVQETLSRVRLASTHGKTFRGNRDMYVALGYKDSLAASDFRDRYDRGDISARLVDAFPKATWRGIGVVYDNDRVELTTAFEQATKELEKRLHLWNMFHRVDKLAGLGQYSVLLIGAPGKADSPLPRNIGPEKIVYVQPYGQTNARIEAFDEDPKSPRYGLPALYSLSRRSTQSTAGISTSGAYDAVKNEDLKVHWTRTIHIAENLLDDNVTGQNRLARVWNRLDDLDKIVGGGAEAFWMRAHPGYQFNLPENFVFKNEEEKQKFNDEVEEFVQGMRRTVRSKGVEMNTFDADVANFDRHAATTLGIIAGACEIPLRLLLGSEQGELASSQDRVNWTERVQDRRTEHAEPIIVRAFFDRLIAHGILAPAKNEYQVWWPEVLDFPLTERTDVAAKQAEINQRQGEIVITTDEIRDQTLGLKPLKEVDPDAAAFNDKKKELALTPPPPPGQPGKKPGQDERASPGNPDVGRGDRDKTQRPPKAASALQMVKP